MQVDFEERVDFRRLHRYRLARTRQALASSGLGAMLVLRSIQHPLHLQHGHRRVGARQADPLLPAHRQRRALGVGFRLGRAPSPALLPVAAEEPLPRRQSRHARGDRARKSVCSKQRRRRSRTSCMQEGVADMPLGIDVSSRGCCSRCRSTASKCATASR